MNILFAADVSISQVIGGAERVLHEQSTRMSQRGHKIHILTRRLPEHAKDSEAFNGVKEWRYEYNPKNPAAFIKTTWLNTKRLFESLHQKYHFDCINFHQPFSTIGINHSEMSTRVPKIYTCHSLSFEEFSSRDMNSNRIFGKVTSFLQIQARKKIENYSLKKSNVIVVLSNFTRNKLVDAYNIPRQKIKTIPGGVDIKKFHPAGDKAATRKQLNIPRDNVILFTVRNLVQRMGLENLIIAFNDLIKQKVAIHLVIGGEGPLKVYLSDLTRSFGIEDHVQFVDFISEEELPLYYQMADIFVLPTKELEGFGLVTLEAMACGLPVLGTPVGGTKEILGKFNPGFIFENTDPKSISEKIIGKYKIIKENPQKWKEISYQCRNFVEKNYSWKKNIDSLEQLFLKTFKNR